MNEEPPKRTLGQYAGLAIGIVVLAVVFAALWGPLNDSIRFCSEHPTDCNCTGECDTGSNLTQLLPILGGTGALLIFVYVFIDWKGWGEKDH